MIAENGFSFVFVASRGMRETSVEGEVKGNGLKANVSVVVDLPDPAHYAIIELLELESFSNRGQQEKRVSDSISNKRLVHELIGDHIWISLEVASHFLPIGYEFLVKVMVGVVDPVEGLADIVSYVVLAPVCLVAVAPIRQARAVQRHFLECPREGEGLVAVDLIYEPRWHSISAVLLRDDVLMEVNERVNAVLSQFIDKLDHFLKVGLIVPIFLRLHACPPKNNSYPT